MAYAKTGDMALVARLLAAYTQSDLDSSKRKSQARCALWALQADLVLSAYKE